MILILQLILIISLLVNTISYTSTSTITTTNTIILYARAIKNNKISGNNDDNNDKFRNDFINLSDNTNIDKKIKKDIDNINNINTKEQNDIVNKNIEELKRVASLLSPSSSSSSLSSSSSEEVYLSPSISSKSKKRIKPSIDDNFSNDDDNNIDFSSSFDINFNDDDSDIPLPSSSLSSSSIRKKKSVNNDLALALINDIEANKDNIDIGTDDDNDKVFVSPRDKAREKLMKQLTEPLPEYGGSPCPLCSRPSTDEEIASFGGKCSLCRQEELSEPDINLEYRYRIRDMKERRIRFSTINDSTTRADNTDEQNLANIRKDLNSNSGPSMKSNSGLYKNDLNSNSGPSMKSNSGPSKNDLNNNSGPSKNDLNIKRWPTVPVGVFDTRGPMTTMSKLHFSSNTEQIVQYNNENDNEEPNDENDVDYADKMANQYDNDNYYQGNDASELWGKYDSLKEEVESLAMNVDKFYDLEDRLKKILDTFINLESTVSELEKKIKILQNKDLEDKKKM